LQVIPSSNSFTRTVLIHLGQFIAMLSCPIGLGAPPSISATWFPPEERTTATAIATLVAYLGLSVAFIIGPSMVHVIPLTNTNSTNNMTVYDIQAMDDNITKYMAYQLGISAFLLLCVIVYFPDKPPLPPSASSKVKHLDFLEGLKKLFTNRSYLHLAFLFSISYGVYFGWLVVLALAVKPFGVGETLHRTEICVTSGILS